MRRAVIALAALLAIQPALAQPQPHGPRPATMSMAGEGLVSAAPDIAIVNAGVVTDGKTARAAVDANSAAMDKVIAAVKAAGVEDRDIATSGFNVQPQWHYPDRRPDVPAEQPRILGYEVRNELRVRVRDIAGLGAILDAALTSGSNQMSGLVFDVSDRTVKLDEARRQAVADARRKAEIYAAAAGVKLGRIVSISEDVRGGPSPVMARADFSEAKAMAVPIAAGERELAVSVQITWEIEG